MEIRKIRDDEKELAFYLGSQAFGFGTKEGLQSTETRWDQWVDYGVWDESGLQAKVRAIEFNVHMGQNVVAPMGGIAGVASLPASRGKGYASKSMKYVLEQLRESGQYLSALHPFNWEFYQKLGYEWVGTKREYSAPVKILKPSPETEFVRASQTSDRFRIEALHNKFSKQYSGEIVRSERMWNRILDDSEKEFNYIYHYERDGVIEGYLTYRGGSKKEVKLREFISMSPRAQSGLLGLLRRMEMQTDKFSWDAPEDDCLWSQFYHWDIETKISPIYMGRIVDFKSAVEAMKPNLELNSAFTISVRDETCPWNSGSWKIEVENGVVNCNSTSADADFSVDIQTLTQIYFGSPQSDYLRHAGRVSVNCTRGYQAASSLFKRSLVWSNLYF